MDCYRIEILDSWERASKAQFDRMIAIGQGELDKSGVAELTFPGRSGSKAKKKVAKKKAAKKR